MKLSSARVDSARMETGDWIGDLPAMDDLRLKVRSMVNKDAQKMRAKLTDALPREKKIGGVVDPDEAERIDNEVMANTVLYGWENLSDDDGAPIPFSSAKALELISDPDYMIFKGAITVAAARLSEIKAVELDDDLGKSAPPSAGAAPGVTSAAS